MSFRRRGDVIAGKVPIPPTSSSSVVRPARPTDSRPTGRPTGRPRSSTEANAISHPGIRPSLVTSQPTISTGTADLDRILLHQGIPLGCGLLIEESSTTDFAAVVARAYVAQGILHNRVTSNKSDPANTHCIIVGAHQSWPQSLPGPYQGSKRDQQKRKIAIDQSKVSVSNASSASQTGNDMKIAWRYGLSRPGRADPKTSSLGSSSEVGDSKTFPHYSHQFDITLRLHPPPGAQDVSFVPVAVGNSAASVISHIRRIIQQHPRKVIRVVIPNLLHPSLYPPECTKHSFIGPFIHALRSLLRQHAQALTVVATLLLNLFPRESAVTNFAESLFDSVIHLQPFNQDMLLLIERAYKNDPTKQQQGLANIIKLPVLAERGINTMQQGEYAFKNGRKRFEIEPWGIPVEDGEDEAPETQSTTKSIEF